MRHCSVFLIFLFLSFQAYSQIHRQMEMVKDTFQQNPQYALELINKLDTTAVYALDSGIFYWYHKGRITHLLTEYETSTLSYIRANDIAERSNNVARRAEILHQLTRVEIAAGRLVKSVERANLTLDHARNKYPEGLAVAYNDLGVTNYYLRDYESAKNFFKLAKEEGQKRNAPDLVNYLRNCAVMFYEIDPGQADSSIYYMKPTLMLYGPDRLQDKATAYSLIGRYFLELKEMDSAEYYLKKGVQTAKQSGNMNVYGTTLTQISNFYREIKAFDQAIALLKESHEHHREAKYYDGMQFTSRVLTSVYTEMRNADSAVHYMYEAQKARDTLFNRERARSLSEFETKLNLADKERQIAQANLETSVERNRTLAVGYAVLVLVVMFGSWIIISKTRTKRRLAEVKAEEQNRAIKAVIKTQEDERRRIARELHDGVGQSMSAIIINQQSIPTEKLSGEVQLKLEKATDLIEKTRKEIRDISHQMMPATLIEVGLAEAIGQMVETSLGVFGINFDYDSMIDTGKRYDEHIEVGVYRICQELIQNIIKHAKPKFVSINLYERNNHLNLLIEDDGSGFNVNQQSEGIGFTNLKTRLEMMNGDLNLESESNQGTMAIVKIPLM